MADPLVQGLYESLHTDGLAARLAAQPDLTSTFEKVDDDTSPEVLARHVSELARVALAQAKPEHRVALANNLLQALQHPDTIHPGPQELRSLAAPAGLRRRNLRRPTTRLSDAALLTNGKDDPNLAAEIRAEMASASRVDLLCAFIRWTGLRLLEPALEELRGRGIRLRVLTSTYMGATERRAIDDLVTKYGAEVRINYETHATRLHAKAWLFRRSTGFDTAYVGSSNLSAAAMLDGLEWNVRLSSVGTARLLQKFEITFDSYWEQRAFQPYDPGNDGDKLDAALARNGGRAASRPDTFTGLEVQPYLHQQEMLEDLESARAIHGRHRNLLVAATGTGKTVVAALDYQRLCAAAGRDLTLLFVAHRQEILKQSLATYRNVLQSGSFGELYVGEHKPKDWKHVFASVQSLAALGIGTIEPGQFDVVVIDEFHHAQAPTYRAILEHLQPQELLGLTATPERGDGINVADQFFSGRTASELRLWDALEADLLVPFHYFGVADDVDLSQVEWKRGNYDTGQLDRLYTGNDARAAKVIKELRDKVTSTDGMRALGFCVSVQHTHYMAEVFNAAGIAAVAVSGQTPDDERAAALSRLRSRELNVIFAVDLFNEGLDLPEVDTIMLLRPTQSATVFLQQLGRGLRRAKDKSVLTVLDYIGQQRREFRFDAKYRALTGLSRKALEKAVIDEFPFLPSGSQIVLDRVAQQIVLANIKAQLRFNRAQLVTDVRSHAELLLEDFLRESGNSLQDVYRKTGDSWTALLRDAGLLEDGRMASGDQLAYIDRPVPVAAGPERSIAEELLVLKRMTQLLCIDDPERADAYTRLTSPGAQRYDDLGLREQTFARMLFFALWPEAGGFTSYDEGIDYLRQFPHACAEIQQLAALGLKRSRYAPKGLGHGLQHIPLYSHATYRREEILAALGFLSVHGRKARHREGVAWSAETKTDAFFVTLEKDVKDRAASIMYKDYALSEDLFHWESQNSTSPESPVGQRYLDHKAFGSQILFFTRARENDDTGMTMPYTCLGQVDYVQHSGSKPIAITWKLQRPMPADVFVSASAVAQ
ncbi:DUF3427 domain-containing protein [Paeniglutamicibacter antarcticus]|uniref:DUF3427 domain-containing protein n=1 Tax=Arthrobacter terrae TaxID=2935737 RepID=A0A931CHP3_9MICC|nr:DUF3427 domain-containing protein [Arthrobacter terrae]